MITLKSAESAGRPDAASHHATALAPLQRLVAWQSSRRHRALTGRVDPRLLLDAGLVPPDAVLAAAAPIDRHILWGIGVRRSLHGPV